MGILNEIKKEVTSDSFRSISGMVFAVEREEVNYLIELAMKLREDLLTALDSRSKSNACLLARRITHNPMQVAVYVTVKDPDAPVYFYINDKKLDESSFRYTHTNNKGEHTLIIKKLELTDAGTLEVKTPLNKGKIANINTMHDN